MNKSIITTLVIVSVILIIPVVNAQKVSTYQSKWNPGVVKDQEEALINKMQFEEKSQFLFLVSNDEKSLYIDLVTADQATVQKIMRYGLTTWLNPDGKPKKTLGIGFPVSSEGKAEPNFPRDKNADRKEMRAAMMASKNQEMTLLGFDEKGSIKVIDPRIDSSFHAKVEMMEGGKIYISLVLPLEILQRADMASFVNPVSVGFETGYMDVTGSGMPSGGGQPSGGGMGGPGMYGGGGPGGMPPGAGTAGTMGTGAEHQERPDIGQLASPTRLWIKQVTLSAKP